jgi:DNA-binding MarR family transcriptional regulator
VRELVVAVRRANVVLEAASLSARDELRIGRTDMVTLELLSLSSMTAGELAQQLSISTGTVTGVVDRLVRVGYAARQIDPRDRRRTVVSITARGRRQFRDAYRTRWEWLHSMASELPVEEIACIVRFLNRMQAIMPEQWRPDVADEPGPGGTSFTEGGRRR